MVDIESLGYPLVYKMNNHTGQTPSMTDAGGPSTAIRVYVRALEGMQKEAVTCMADSSGKHTWRMVCDEGPYLNGTDLAPFPLAFFSAGMQFSYLSELIRHARTHDVTLKSLCLNQDNYYTMDGSALQGTMIGGAKPAELQIEIESDAPADKIAPLARLAERSSPVQALMRDLLTNSFALTHNQQSLPLNELRSSPQDLADNPDHVFTNARPDDSSEWREDIIRKISSAQKTFGVEGGAGSSLQADQKRTLHVHAEARMVDGLLLDTTIQLYKPIGSTFRFISDETRAHGGQESAPPPLAYLAAGIGLCYMTQIGRYAHITKQALRSYQIIQDSIFRTQGSDADESQIGHADAIHTHVYLESDETDAIAQKTVQMGERTCFLHAAMRSTQPSILGLKLNSNPVPVPATTS